MATYKDWIQDAGTTGDTLYWINGGAQGSHPNHANTYDGDFNTDVDVDGSTSSQVTTEFEFDTAADIVKVIFKAYASGYANPPGGIGSTYVKVYLYYNSQWNIIYEDTSGVNGDSGDENNPITVEGNWSDVTKIKVDVYSHHSSIYGSATNTELWEVQCFSLVKKGYAIII